MQLVVGDAVEISWSALYSSRLYANTGSEISPSRGKTDSQARFETVLEALRHKARHDTRYQRNG